MSNELEKNPVTNEESREIEQEIVEPAKPAISPGKELSRRREELDLTVEQVAAHLNLAPRQIQAIEADNFDALPGIAIARGFVRSYAKVVGVDADPLLAAMAPAIAPMTQADPVKQAYANKPLGGKNLSFDEGGGRKAKLKWIALAAAVVIVLLIVFQQRDSLSWSETSEEGATQSQPGPAASSVAPDGRAVELLPQPEFSTTPVPEAPSEVPAPQSSGASATNNHPLLLKAKQESWIELKGVDGSILASRLIEAGTEVSFPLASEMILTIGNAAGVDIVLRGQPLDVQSNTRGNITRINVK